MAASYKISVSLMTGCYRHIQISGNATLYNLHMAIQEAFSFDNDHSHGFFMDDRLWSRTSSYFGESMEERKCQTSRHTLNRLKLKTGDKFKYLFDFGDNWVFQCKILKELAEETPYPTVVRSVGDSPEQYPDAGLEEVSPSQEDAFPETYDDVRLKQMYHSLSLPMETVQTIRDYCVAAANLYGILPLRQLLKIYNQQNPPISQEAFLEAAEVIRHDNHYYSILGQEFFYGDAPISEPIDREIVGDWLYECGEDDYKELSKAQAGKPYAIVPKDEFLRYTDQFYYPITPETQAMTAFFERKLAGKNVSVPDVVSEIVLHVLLNDNLKTTFIRLANCGVTFNNDDSLEEFLQLYVALNNNSRKQTNRGYSPVELARLQDAAPDVSGMISMSDVSGVKPEQYFSRIGAIANLFKATHMPDIQPPFAAPKPISTTISGTPSRNAPCPCGSGRKYKNCCGKK